MSDYGAIMATLALLLVAASCLTSILGVVLCVHRLRSVKRFRARAGHIRGTVLESPVSVSSGGTMVGAVYVPTGGRIASCPVVAYPGLDGRMVTARVRYPASQIYVYGQPVDLLVAPDDPLDVRLDAADGSRGTGRWIFLSIALPPFLAVAFFLFALVTVGFFATT